MGYADEQKLVNMENTIMRWKREVDKVRVCLVGSVLVSLLLTLLFSEKSDRVIIWAICAVFCGVCTFFDITLQRYITEGERELYSASKDLIDRKEKLAGIGALDFDAAASRRLLDMHIPDNKVKIPLALYIIADGIALAGLIIALVKFF